MTDLPVCRWREHRDGGALYCRSEKYVGPPNRVDADFCLSCGYRDHTPAAKPIVNCLPAAAGARIAVATLYTPEIAEIGVLTSEVLRAYAARHGYAAVIAAQVIDESRPAPWSKLLLVERYLAQTPSCEWVMWIDADAVVTNPAQKVEDLVDREVDFLAAEDLPPSPINTGVFLVRNCPAALDLLRRAYAKVQYIHHPWWDQPAVVEARRESGDRLRSRIVPRRLFNSFAGEHQAGDFVLHFAGCSREAKAAGLRKAVPTALAAASGCRISFEQPADAGSLDLAHAAFVSGCVLSKKPERVVELGIGAGYTSWALVRALAYNGRGRLTCVDAWCDWSGKEPGHIEALRCAGVEIVITSEEAFVKSCPSESVDILISDADHGRSQEWLDQHLRIVKPGGFLFFHDTNNPDFPNLAAIVTGVGHLPHYHFTDGSRPAEQCSRGLLFVIKP